jgi:hypothetical protein
MSNFKPDCLPVLIGSLPIADHAEAARLIFDATPEIPLWPQLPLHREEGMLFQFLPGFPGKTEKGDKVFIDASSAEFDNEVLAFYEEYMAVTEGAADIDTSRFALTTETAKGFFAFLDLIDQSGSSIRALKGQITGPITFATAIKDENGRAVFYNDQLKDIAVKLLALKAGWQVRRMKEKCETAMVFFDEPGLAGFGSSAFITIGAEEIKACLNEVCATVHAEQGLAGVHVCANTEWPIVFEADVDIVSCDTYSYFDKFLLYPGHLLGFFNRGGILANGIIPTIPEFIDRETADSLTARWLEQRDQLQAIGIDKARIFAQSMITPSCGTGSISMEYTRKVLELTREVSSRIRSMR